MSLKGQQGPVISAVGSVADTQRFLLPDVIVRNRSIRRRRQIQSLFFVHEPGVERRGLVEPKVVPDVAVRGFDRDWIGGITSLNIVDVVHKSTRINDGKGIVVCRWSPPVPCAGRSGFGKSCEEPAAGERKKCKKECSDPHLQTGRRATSTEAEEKSAAATHHGS